MGPPIRNKHGICFALQPGVPGKSEAVERLLKVKKEKLVLVGNGMAGMQTIEELLKLDPEKYDITVFGSEPYGNYNRILLSPVLAGEKSLDDIMIHDEAWYAERGITLHKGVEITEIDRRRRRVVAADGSSADYSRLLLATGSKPFILPVPGHDLPGVVTFRDIDDVNRLLAASEEKQIAVVIGGGLLGLEAANGLAARGMHVTVIHLMETLMERQLDAAAGRMLRRSLEDRGFSFLMPAKTAEIIGKDRACGVRLEDGTEVAADIVVMAVGIQPNADLAQQAGLHCERGIVVNDTMQTFDARIYAGGECVQHRGVSYGLVAPLFVQAKVCANHLAELGYARYPGSVTSTKLKVSGIDVFSAGEFAGGADTEEIVFQDKARGVYKRLLIEDNRIRGAVLYGDTVDGSWYFNLMRDGSDVTDLRERLLFGRSRLGSSGHGLQDAVAEMGPEEEVCGCNGISKGEIVRAITEKNLYTLAEVRAHTKASSSCGSCTGLVEQIMVSVIGDYSPSPKEAAMCPCTDFTHKEVRRAIGEHRLMRIDEVLSFLEARNTDGCATCRPALNYYLLCAWPGEYRDDPQSRFINERVHANIQKDGSYSVVPRMWGGLTTPGELRAIAEVAEKFEVPMVKVTGGQRIDLLGIAKEQLPKVWKDLNRAGLISGHAYGKSVRTVKTCVGSQWCRFGVQDSTALGVRLEKLSWGSWTPHKFKMAVSGCPRNCAEATIKDFGVVAVESGWELHIGGNGGVRVRATELLCKVRTEEEVIEYAAAFLQLYREEAHYLERTAPWIERVGLTYVKERIVKDEAGRKELCQRFLKSQKYAQIDPWAERTGEDEKRCEFKALAVVG
jgi:nitrite reductase (NADH) large subunit